MASPVVDQEVDLSSRNTVLFDFDGTLADTKPCIVRVARQVLGDWGMSDEEMGDLGRLVGPPFPRAFSMIYGLSEADAYEVTRRYRSVYNVLGPEACPLYPGMAGLLADLRRAGKRLGVATSKRQPLVERMLGFEGILDEFDVVVGQESAEHSDKAFLMRHCLDLLGASADDAAMVGDRFYDVEGARSCGVPCVGVLFGTAERSELEQAGACAIVESAGELGRVLLG